MNRRKFLQNVALAGAATSAPLAGHSGEISTPSGTREKWIETLVRVAEPVLLNLAEHRLKERMPVEAATGLAESRRAVTHLEALGRTICGIAPWLDAKELSGVEETRRARLADLARRGIENAISVDSADRIDFTAAAQNLVDASFLALGLARARRELWERFSPATKQALTAALQSTRKFKPGQNNWLLFSATIEAFLANVGAPWEAEAIETAIASHEAWYKGDGAYGDGRDFHWDYYNSFVIQPMLLAVLDLMNPIDKRWEKYRASIHKRAIRYAAVQELHIAPDGTFPPLGRSMTYRCGAFHHLAEIALRRNLPASLAPAQVRCALWAVIHRTLSAQGTFDKDGWLRIGLAGHQPSLGERYISTGSLYLCTFAFLPLGLPPSDEFWASPAADWTSRKAWAGQDVQADHSI